MSAIVGAELQYDRFISADPANGMLAAINTAGAAVNVVAWSPLTGDTTWSAPAGSGSNTRIHQFDRPINSTSTITGTTFTSSAIVTSGSITQSATASKLVPGATSWAVRNNADGADNLLISNAGAATVRNGFNVLAGTSALQAVTATTITASGVVQVPVTVGLAFGGTTSSFVALSRSGTTLLVRLADNSGYAGLQAETATINSALTVSAGLTDIQGGTDDSVSSPAIRVAYRRIITMRGSTGDATAAYLYRDATNFYIGVNSAAAITITASTQAVAVGTFTATNGLFSTYATVGAGGLTPTTGNFAVNESGVRSWQFGYGASSGNFSINSGDGGGFIRTNVDRIDFVGSGISAVADGTARIYNQTGVGLTLNGASTQIRNSSTVYATFSSTGVAVTGQVAATSTGADVVGAFKNNSNGTRTTQIHNADTTGDNILCNFYTEGGSGTLRGSIDYNRGGGVIRYNTTSDARLKVDLGRFADVAMLRALVIHDFMWQESKTRAIGLFAQEAHRVYPAAVKVGGANAMKDPWQVDNSAFVPPLIAGWQNHDERLGRIEALLNLN